ncbi:unnamed protein product [Candidula unifasciata]|uniref:Profilin n=1 Tax=Candidula unifasciata TaxID=100452 RepID=A0A8S3ZDA6_9EUPU|nr:unnamed protein product [Candidula unifasciata]
MTVTVPKWQQFITESLLQSHLFSGLCLISNQNEVIYDYGTLKYIDKTDTKQLNMFVNKNTQETTACFHLGVAGRTFHFRIYYRTHVSIYATASGNQCGLTISKLPHGIFVTMFQKPTMSHKAITLVEDFTDRLRC